MTSPSTNTTETQAEVSGHNTEKRPPSLMQDILSLLIKIFIVLTIFMLIFTFLFGIFTADDMTMKTAVQDGDIVIFYRLANDYVASDAAVLEYEGQRQIRRIIAVAGDTVDITEEGLFINGSFIAEQSSQKLLLFDEGVTFPLTVPEGHVFMLGDNREQNVADSRLYGTVAIKDLLGKVTTIIRQRNI